MQYKHRDCNSNDQQTFLEQRIIRNLAGRIQAHNLFLQIRLRLELIPVKQDEYRLHDNEDQYADGRQIPDEIHEVQSHRAADHDIRRIADQRSRAANVRRQDLRDQVRLDINLELSRNAEGNRHRQQDGRNIIQQSRANHGQRRKSHQQGNWPGLDLLGGPDGQKVEQSRFAGNIDDDHHTHQKAQGIEVNVGNSGLLTDDATEYHQHGANNSDNGAVHLLRNNQRIGRHKN